MEGVQSVQGTEYYVCTEGEDFNCIIVGYLVIEMNQQPTVSFFFSNLSVTNLWLFVVT